MKEKIIRDFEDRFWKIDDNLKVTLLELKIEDLISKIIEWQEWYFNKSYIQIGGVHD